MGSAVFWAALTSLTRTVFLILTFTSTLRACTDYGEKRIWLVTIYPIFLNSTRSLISVKLKCIFLGDSCACIDTRGVGCIMNFPKICADTITPPNIFWITFRWILFASRATEGRSGFFSSSHLIWELQWELPTTASVVSSDKTKLRKLGWVESWGAFALDSVRRKRCIPFQQPVTRNILANWSGPWRTASVNSRKSARPLAVVSSHPNTPRIGQCRACPTILARPLVKHL